MERDPVRYVWRAAPGLNAGAIGLALLVGLPLLWLSLDLVATIVDDGAAGLAYAGGNPTAPFMRYAIDLPARIREEPLVILPGLDLPRGEVAFAAMVGLALAAALATGLAVAVGLMRAAIGQRAAASLVDRLVEGIAAAPLAAAEEARGAAALAGAALSDRRGFLGSALLAPALSLAAIAAATLYLAAADALMAGALIAGLAIMAVAAGAAVRPDRPLRGRAGRRVLGASAGARRPVRTPSGPRGPWHRRERASSSAGRDGAGLAPGSRP